MKRKRSVFSLCICSAMAALYFVLAHFLTFRIGNLHISFASLPIVLLAAFYGITESCLAAFLGEFLNQILSYGLTVTTPLWLLPPIIRAALLSLGFFLIHRKTVKEAWHHPFPFIAVVFIAAVLTTLMNTLVIWLDSLIGHYFSIAYVFGDLLIRLAAGMLTALAVGAVSIPVLTALSRSIPSQTQHQKKV